MEQVNDIAMSPLPNSPKKEEKKALLNFYDALKEVVNGKKITRIDWQDSNIYAFMQKYGEHDILHIRTEAEKEGTYKVHQWVVALQDMVAEDWVVL